MIEMKSDADLRIGGSKERNRNDLVVGGWQGADAVCGWGQTARVVFRTGLSRIQRLIQKYSGVTAVLQTL